MAIPQTCPKSAFSGGIAIPNGVVCYTGTVPGSGHIAQPFCNIGFSSPTEYILCQSDGTWSEFPIECLEQKGTS